MAAFLIICTELITVQEIVCILYLMIKARFRGETGSTLAYMLGMLSHSRLTLAWLQIYFFKKSFILKITSYGTFLDGEFGEVCVCGSGYGLDDREAWLVTTILAQLSILCLLTVTSHSEVWMTGRQSLGKVQLPHIFLWPYCLEYFATIIYHLWCFKVWP